MNEETYRISEGSAYNDLDIDDFTNEDDRETIMEELYADRNRPVSRVPEER